MADSGHPPAELHERLLICQLVMGVICFFAAQMLLQKKFRIFNKRWWLETAVNDP